MLLIIGLVAWSALCFLALRSLALSSPEHRVWPHVDVLYYSLTLGGIILLFIAETPERAQVGLYFSHAENPVVGRSDAPIRA